MFPIRKLDPLIKQIRRFFFLYKRGMYYKGIAWGEINNVMDVVFHSITVVTMLKVYGISYSLTGILIACVVFTLFLSIIGKLLVIWGVVAYGNQIQNQQNPWEEHLKQILKELEEIKDKL